MPEIGALRNNDPQVIERLYATYPLLIAEFVNVRGSNINLVPDSDRGFGYEGETIECLATDQGVAKFEDPSVNHKQVEILIRLSTSKSSVPGQIAGFAIKRYEIETNGMIQTVRTNEDRFRIVSNPTHEGGRSIHDMSAITTRKLMAIERSTREREDAVTTRSTTKKRRSELRTLRQLDNYISKAISGIALG